MSMFWSHSHSFIKFTKPISAALKNLTFLTIFVVLIYLSFFFNPPSTSKLSFGSLCPGQLA